MHKILEQLKIKVPEFYQFEEFDNLLTVDFDRLSSFTINLYSLHHSSPSVDKEIVIKKIFNFLNDQFDKQSEEIINLYRVTIFEGLIGFHLGYFMAKKYFSPILYSKFTEFFPFESHKNDWDESDHYSDLKIEKLIKSLNK